MGSEGGVTHISSRPHGKRKKKTQPFVLLAGRLELPRVVIMEPPLSVGSSEIEGNCDDQFKLDEFLRMVLITAGSIFFFFFLKLFSFGSLSCSLWPFFFVTLANVFSLFFFVNGGFYWKS